MSDKSNQKETVKHLENVKAKSDDKDFKQKIDEKIKHIKEPLNK